MNTTKSYGKVWLVGAGPGDPGLMTVRGLEVLRRADVIVCFVTSRSELARRFPALKQALEPDGGLWIAWPKRSSGVDTDMSEDAVREVGLPGGLVDNKVCALDRTWSGLRLVVRVENREAVAYRAEPPARPEWSPSSTWCHRTRTSCC